MTWQMTLSTISSIALEEARPTAILGMTPEEEARPAAILCTTKRRCLNSLWTCMCIWTGDLVYGCYVV
jgi:hypothetical protein